MHCLPFLFHVRFKNRTGQRGKYETSGRKRFKRENSPLSLVLFTFCETFSCILSLLLRRLKLNNRDYNRLDSLRFHIRVVKKSQSPWTLSIHLKRTMREKISDYKKCTKKERKAFVKASCALDLMRPIFTSFVFFRCLGILTSE